MLRSLTGRGMAVAAVCGVAAQSRNMTRCASASAGVATTSTAASAAAEAAVPSASLSNIIVYQYAICPFCARVKAYLDYKQIPYTSVEVNPLFKSEIAFSKAHKKVPIATFDGKQVNESGAIVDFITSSLLLSDAASSNTKTNSSDKKKNNNNNSSSSSSSNGKTNSLKAFLPEDTAQWSEWSEKKLAVMLYPNITRSFSESWECFEYTTRVPEWNVMNQWTTRVAGAAAMSLANGKIKKKYNIVDERAELKTTLAEWTRAVGSKKFLHGDAITLPDLMVFGVLRSISDLSTFREIMADNKELLEWYVRVDEQTPSADTKKKSSASKA